MAFSSGRAVPTMSAVDWEEREEEGGAGGGGGFVKLERQFNSTAQEDEPMAKFSAQAKRRSVVVLDWEEVTCHVSQVENVDSLKGTKV